MKKLLLFASVLLTGILFAQNPIIQNPEFVKIEKKFGNDCECSQWIATDLGVSPQGSGIGLVAPNRGLKSTAGEDQVLYQEVAILPNTDYKFTYLMILRGGGAAEAEIRILKGSSYRDGYAPVYYSNDNAEGSGLRLKDRPNTNFGYKDIAEVELAANNLAVATHDYLGNNSDYLSYELTFSSGSETSIALFMRGIGEKDVIFDSVSLTNEGTTAGSASVEDVFGSSLSIYPNPASTNITVKSSEIHIESVEIINMLGSTVLRDDSANETIDVSVLKSGVYVMKINSENSSSTRRIFID